jgi:hypothetical protein
MANLETILFGEGDFNEKKSYIDNMFVDVLMAVDKSIVKRIIEKCGNDNKRLYINNERRQGNNWNSLVEFFDISGDNVLLGIYVQNTKTDTTMIEYFDKFFRRGEYYSRDNRLNESVDYKEGQKAEVMRSILLECIYDQFNNDVQREKLIGKLGHYTIVNPVLNYFFNEWRLKYRQISKYSSRDDVVKNKAYYYGKKKIDEYIENNVESLLGKTAEELQAIYKKVFMDAYNEFDKTFDYNKWRKETTLWY